MSSRNFGVEAGLIDITLQRRLGLEGGWAHFGDINSLLHGDLPVLLSLPRHKMVR